MIEYYLFMNQGLVADLREVVLCSGQFSTCAPIVMFNEHTSIGGLYHLEGCSQLNRFRSRELMEMASRIDPTQVHVLKANSISHVKVVSDLLGLPYGRNSAKREVKNYFAKKADDMGMDLEGISYTSVRVRCEGGELVIDKNHPTDSRIINLTRQAIQTLPGSVSFIGDSDASRGWIQA